PGDQLFGGGGVVGLEADEGFRHFPPFLVGEGDDGDFGDGGVIGQRLLDFNGGDVLAAGDDDVLHAVAHFDVAIGVDDGEVAGVEPAALKGVRSGFGIVVIAEHDVVAAHEDFAHALAIGGDIVHVVVGDPEVHAGDQVGHALAGFELGALGRGQFVPGGLPGADGVRAVGFGEAVEVREFGAGFLGGADDGGRRGRAGNRDAQWAAELHAVGGAILGQGTDDHGRAAEVGDAFGFDEAHGFARVGLAQADVTAAGGGDGPGETPAVAVEQGERPEVDAALGQLVLGDFADGVGPGAAVGEHDAFGEAGGAGGVVDGDAGVFVGDGDWGGERLAGGSACPTQETLVVVDYVRNRGIGNQGLELRVHQEGFGTAMVKDPLQFGGGETGVEHHQDGADPHGGEVALERQGAVGSEDGDAIAGLHAESEQGGRLTIHASAEFGVGEAAVALDDGGEIAPGVNAARQEIEWSER